MTKVAARIAAVLPACLLAQVLYAGEIAVQPRNGDLIAVCGDSITEQRGYSLMMAAYLTACQPCDNLGIMNFGAGGESARGFAERVDPTVLSFHPDVVTLCYGMNDGGIDQYRQSMEKSILLLKKGGVRSILLATPGVVDTQTFRAESAAVKNQLLGRMGKAAEELARKNGIGFVEIHNVMMEAMRLAKAKYGQNYTVAGTDGVHPDRNGHLVMAYCILKALGCKGDIGKITVDMKAEQATATAGHRVVSFAKEKLDLESKRYPFCFTGDPLLPSATTGMIEFIPFNQDLNRYLLVVRNPTASSMKVTWGKASKRFSAERLLKGINLAAEFLDNPFSRPFADVEDHLRNQQATDLYLSGPESLIKMAIRRRDLNPEIGDKGFTELIDAAVKFDSIVRAHMRATIVPVAHRIVIESVSP